MALHVKEGEVFEWPDENEDEAVIVLEDKKLVDEYDEVRVFWLKSEDVQMYQMSEKRFLEARERTNKIVNLEGDTRIESIDRSFGFICPQCNQNVVTMNDFFRIGGDMSKNTLVGAGAAVLGEALLACKTLADLFSAIQAYKTYDNYPPVEQFENLELEYTDPNNNVKCTNCGRGFNV